MFELRDFAGEEESSQYQATQVIATPISSTPSEAEPEIKAWGRLISAPNGEDNGLNGSYDLSSSEFTIGKLCSFARLDLNLCSCRKREKG